MPRTRQGDEGFTLIEVLVAAGLVAVAFMFMITVVGGMTNQSIALQRKDRAVTLAQTVLDRLRANNCGMVAPDPPQGAATLTEVNKRCVAAPANTGAIVTGVGTSTEVGDVRYTNYRDTGLTPVASDGGGRSGLRFDVATSTTFDLEGTSTTSTCAAYAAAQKPTTLVQTVRVSWTGGDYSLTSRVPVPSDSIAAVSSTRGSIAVPLAGNKTGAYIKWNENGTTYVLRRWASVEGPSCLWFPFLDPNTPYEVGTVDATSGALSSQESGVRLVVGNGAPDSRFQCIPVGQGTCP
ncbi:MAG: type IV pilus modification PilV family protein [Acidimicrobiia bacterium]